MHTKKHFPHSKQNKPKQNKLKQNKTIKLKLKNKISNYICNKKEKDICCEDDVDRKNVIDQILKLYIDIAKIFNEDNDYLSFVNNDLIKFIGYKSILEEEKDIKGVNLWKEIDEKSFKNKILNKEKIIIILNNVPLYYLLSFLGYAYYKYNLTKNV